MHIPKFVRSLGGTAAVTIAAVAATTLAAITGTTDRTPVTEPFNGPVIANPSRHVLTGATVHTRPGQTINNASVVIADGTIVSVRSGAPTAGDTRGAQVHDYSGHHLYAGFIDAWVGVDAPKPNADSPGVHWCNRVTPQRDALAGEGLDNGTAESLRELGFAAAAISPNSGVFRGMGAVVSTAKDFEQTGQGEPPVYKARAFHAMGFDRSGWADAVYPTSVPGVMALMRQSLSDADWQSSHDTEPNCLDTLADKNTPFFFDTTHELMSLLADDVATEASRKAVLVGTGDEFRTLDAITKLGHPIIVPLRHPKKPDVSSPGKADAIALGALMRWEQAPTNARRLVNAGASVAITTSKVTKRGQFHKHLAEAIKHGLTADQALAALTTTPAQILDITDRLGAVEPGKIASLVISKAPLGDKDFEPTDLWIDGRRHEISTIESHVFDGTWTIQVVGGGFEMQATIDGDSITNIEGEGDDQAESKGRNVAMDGNRISWIVDDDDDGSGSYLVSGTLVNGTMTGIGVAPDQSQFAWTATKTAPLEPKEEDGTPTDDASDVPESYGYPFGPYARNALPQQETVVVNGATIWTSGPDGVIENGLLIVSNGKIVHVGRALDPAAPAFPNGARVIDAQGKHVTPGL
ncbi:MAG: amidohydrolase family protein, partial [Planctomycetota bacterium]